MSRFYQCYVPHLGQYLAYPTVTELEKIASDKKDSLQVLKYLTQQVTNGTTNPGWLSFTRWSLFFQYLDYEFERISPIKEYSYDNEKIITVHRGIIIDEDQDAYLLLFQS